MAETIWKFRAAVMKFQDACDANRVLNDFNDMSPKERRFMVEEMEKLSSEIGHQAILAWNLAFKMEEGEYDKETRKVSWI